MDKSVNDLKQNNQGSKSSGAKPLPLWADAIIRAVVWFTATIGLMMGCGFVLDQLEFKVHWNLWLVMGEGATLFTALIGTPIHELGHFIMCLIFGFHVEKVELLRPFKYKEDGILGMVTFSADYSNLWGQIGMFFVGIAPLIFGGLFILLVLKLLVPEAYNKADKLSDETWKEAKEWRGVKSGLAFVKGFVTGLFSIRGWGILRAIISVYVITSISMHMTYSSQDMENAMIGLAAVLLLYLIFGFITALLKVDKYLLDAIEVASGLIMFFMIGFVSDLLLLGISKILMLIFN